MDKRNELVFSKDGQSFWFVFKDGKESISFGSKEEGYDALKDLCEKGKITEREREHMTLQIVDADNLFSYGSFKDETNSRLVFLKGVVAYLEKEVDEASFQMDMSGEMKALIICKKVVTDVIENREDAFLYAEELMRIKHITDEEYEKVKKEIEESKLQ